MRIAAPVGVVISISTVDSASGTPLRISAVAGAGRGIRPCAALIQPRPGGTGLASNRSTPSRSSPTAEPTMSMIESTAPTSWKWIFDRSMPCTAPRPRRASWKIRFARSFCRGVRLPLSMIASMWCQWRWACSCGPDDPGVRRPEAAAPDGLEREFARQAQARDGLLDRARVDPCIDQGAERHVARDPAEAVEIRNRTRRTPRPVLYACPTCHSIRARACRRSECRRSISPPSGTP